MSRRYGRNQRRRARERIKDLETTIAMDRSLLRQTTARLEEAREINASIQRIVGANSILLPPQRVTMDGVARDRILFGVQANLRSFYGAPGSIRDMQYTVNELRVMLSKLEADHTLLQQHVIVNFAGRRWGYAINEEAAVALARAGELEQYVAQVLARQISEDLKKAGEKHAYR